MIQRIRLRRGPASTGIGTFGLDRLRSHVIGLIAISMTTAGMTGWVNCVSAQEARTWTDSTGKQKTEAIFVKMENQVVTLRKPGTDKTVKVPFDRLSDEDQVYVEDLLADLKAKQRRAERERETQREAAPVDKQEASSTSNTAEDEAVATNQARTVPNNVVNSVRGAVYREQTMERLRQIATALTAYQVQYGRFPQAAITARDRKPLLSWRVALLPMLEENMLHREFRLNEPWDSEHNKALIDRMPKVFESPGSSLGKGYTNYLAVAGMDTVLSMGRRATRPEDVRDGLSKTLMIVEVDDTHAVPWTKPEEYVWDASQPTQGLGQIWPSQFFGAFADGRVARLSTELNLTTLNGLATRAGGEVIRLDD